MTLTLDPSYFRQSVSFQLILTDKEGKRLGNVLFAKYPSLFYGWKRFP